MTTIRNILLDALGLIQVLDHDEQTMETSLENKAIRALHMLIEDWSALPLLQIQSTVESFDLVATVNEYTIGPTADFDTHNPYIMDKIYLTFNNRDTSLKPINETSYFNIGDKAQPGIPDRYFFKLGHPQSKLFFYPSPNKSGYTLTMASFKPLIPYPITDIDIDLDLLPVYITALTYNLAVYLAPVFATEVPVAVAAVATSSIQTLSSLSPTRTISAGKIDKALLDASYKDIYYGGL